MRLLKRGLLYVVLFGALGGATVPPTADRHSRDAPADVEGRGFGAVLVCAECIMGGIVLAAEGPGAILVAANAPGSAVGVAACVTACVEAFN